MKGGRLPGSCSWVGTSSSRRAPSANFSSASWRNCRRTRARPSVGSAFETTPNVSSVRPTRLRFRHGVKGSAPRIVEAMACRVPCVVARLDGITDFVFGAPVNGPGGGPGDGVVVPQDEPGDLSRALLELLDRPDWAAEVAAAGLQRARAHFDLETVVAPAYEALYADVIKQGPRI